MIIIAKIRIEKGLLGGASCWQAKLFFRVPRRCTLCSLCFLTIPASIAAYCISELVLYHIGLKVPTAHTHHAIRASCDTPPHAPAAPFESAARRRGRRARRMRRCAGAAAARPWHETLDDPPRARRGRATAASPPRRTPRGGGDGGGGGDRRDAQRSREGHTGAPKMLNDQRRTPG